MVLETGIFASHAIWLWRVRHTRRAAKKAGQTYDEYVAEHPTKKIPRCDSSETFVDVEAGRQDSKSSDTCTEKTCSPPDTAETASHASEEHVQVPPAAVVKAA
jgi:hypothetical protein